MRLTHGRTLRVSAPAASSAPSVAPRPLSPPRPPRLRVIPAATHVGVVLPVHNLGPAAPAIVAEVAGFAAANPDYRFLFVDDGSTDDSSALIRQALAAVASPAPRANLDLLTLSANVGKGGAVRRGMLDPLLADAQVLLFTDGDLAYSLDQLPRLVAALEHADVAIGCRRSDGGDYAASPLRHIMGAGYNRIVRLWLGQPFPDTQAGLKGFRAAAARALFAPMRTTGFAFDAELLYIARKRNLTVTQVPAVVAPAHRAGGSSVRLLADPARMLAAMTRVSIAGASGSYTRHADPASPRPKVALSFDAEEFDLPNELGRPIPEHQQLAVAAEGMRRALDLLADAAAPATFFTTARFAAAHPALVRQAADQGHEIASHGMSHSAWSDADPARSRLILEKISGSPVTGFRRARMAPVDPAALRAAGYLYDSSVHPTWLPGRYNSLDQPRRIHRLPAGNAPSGEPATLLRIPPSVTPLVRAPLFWLAFKNFPAPVYRALTRATLRRDGVAALYFHPWEFADLAPFKLPRHIAGRSGDALSRRFAAHLRWLSSRADFTTYHHLAATAKV